MEITDVKIQSAKFGDSAELIYNVSYTDGVTTLEQNLKLMKVGHKWTAIMEFDGFESQASPQDAAYKFAEWLKKMGIAVRCGEYGSIDLNKI